MGTLDKATVSLKTMMTIISSLVAFMFASGGFLIHQGMWIRDQVQLIRADIRDVAKRVDKIEADGLTITWAQVWTDNARVLNKEIKLPDPMDIHGKVKLRQLRGMIDHLLDGDPFDAAARSRLTAFLTQ